MSDNTTPTADAGISKNAQKKAEKAAKAAAEKAAKAAAKAAAPVVASGKKAAGVNEEELDPSVRMGDGWRPESGQRLRPSLGRGPSSDQFPCFWLP